jgi:hypothetical protein
MEKPQEIVQVKDLIVGERYSSSSYFEPSIIFIVKEIDESGTWIAYINGDFGLLYTSDSYKFYKFPYSSLEKELT